jgi:ferredoxin
MASQRLANSQKVSMIYAGRSREMMAYLPEVSALLGDSLRLHIDTEVGAPLNVQALLDECGEHDRIYVCGPKVMLDAVLAETNQRHWPKDRVHFELFAAPIVQQGDHEFEVQLVQSGSTYKVAADQTILDCLIDHGCDPLFDCKRGECGICAVPVIEGEIDHRDYVLSDAEKKEGKVMHICISRAKGQRVVLDL